MWSASAHPTQSPPPQQSGLTQQQFHASSNAVYAVPSTVGSLLDPQFPSPNALRYSAIRADESLRAGAANDPRYPHAQRSSKSHQVRRKSHSQLMDNDSQSSPPLAPLPYKLCTCAPTVTTATTTVAALQAQQQEFFERQQQQQQLFEWQQQLLFEQQQQQQQMMARANERQLQHQAHAGSPLVNSFGVGPSSSRQSSRQQREHSASRGSNSPTHPQALLHASHNPQSRLAYQS